MPTDLPPDYKPKPVPKPGETADAPAPGLVPNPPGSDSPRPPGGEPPVGPDVANPVPAPTPAGLPSF